MHLSATIYVLITIFACVPVRGRRHLAYKDVVGLVVQTPSLCTQNSIAMNFD